MCLIKSLVSVCLYTCACGFARCLESAIEMIYRSKASGECAVNLTGLAAEILLCLQNCRFRLEQQIAVQSGHGHPFYGCIFVTFSDISFKILRNCDIIQLICYTEG